MINPRPYLSPDRLIALYQRLLATYGQQQWWPADHPFEVMIGAVLTQNTNWSNVERALHNLRMAGHLDLQALMALPSDQLAQLIRPSGYYNIKSQRLKALGEFLLQIGGEQALAELPLDRARNGLLAVKGIGPETADDILLYALDKPVFVIDSYTRRLLQRHAMIHGDEPYETLRTAFEKALPPDPKLFKQYHALIVEHAKQACRKRPVCDECGISSDCAFSQA